MTAKDHVYTLGIEEEFAIVDPQTRELRSHIQEILEGGKVTLKEQIKPEMHQSVVELGTDVCGSIGDAREHVPGRDNLSWGKFLQAAVNKRSLGELA